MTDNLTKALRLVLVTDDDLLVGSDLPAIARAAVAGGVTAIQLRLKRATPRQLIATLFELRAAVTVPLLVNDRPDVACAGGAGVHLGPGDLSPGLARLVLGPERVIGASVGDDAEIERGQPADYWGIGPWRTTTTKADAGTVLGRPGFARLAALAGGRPRVAIGGVRPDDVAEIFAAGGTGVAVVSGILAAADVRAAAWNYAEQIRLALTGSA